MDFSKLDATLAKLSKLDEIDENSFNTLSKSCLHETGNLVASAAKNQVKPEDEDGQSLIERFNIIRRIGNKFVNMFKIEFKITFCGVVLCHLEIPKLETNQSLKK